MAISRIEENSDDESNEGGECTEFHNRASESNIVLPIKSSGRWVIKLPPVTESRLRILIKLLCPSYSISPLPKAKLKVHRGSK